MIQLDDIKGRSVLDLLRNYEGINPYLKRLRNDYLKNNKIQLTDTQIKYIQDNHDKEPILINRLISFTKYLGEEFKNQLGLKFVPERMLVEYILAENEKAFHVYGKMTQKQVESKMYWLPKTQVIGDIYFEEIEVDVNFDKYNKVLSKSGKKLYQHQETGIKFLLSRNGCILGDDMGLGKMEFVDNQLFTPTGRLRIGDVKIGDKVIGSNGLPCNVTGVFPRGIKDLYRVTFNDGYSVLVGGEHLWRVSSSNNGKYITLSTEQMLDENLVLEQKSYKIKTFYKQKNGNNKWQIPIVQPIEFNNNNILPVEPYLFGISLVDDNINEDTKFIPDIYKFSSIENRLALLEGLIDGNETKYCSISEQLVDDVAEIVHSLGGIVRKSSCNGSYKLNIKMPICFNPFRLKQKSDIYSTPKKYKIGRYIKDIKLEKQGEAICISVDAPDKLYVTEHAIVTHNTTQSIVAALESGAESILVVCPSSAKINWIREINTFCDDAVIIDGKKWSKGKFTVINFDILKNFHTLTTDIKEGKEPNRQLVDAKFDLCIIDEAHYLKNNDSIRGRIMVELTTTYEIPKVWLLTGTPIANRPMDFFNLLKIIKSPLTENWKFFVVRYCAGKQFYKTLKNGKKKQIWLTDGASNLDELSVKTRNLVLRRMKTHVLDMPDKIIIPTYHRLSDSETKEYNLLWDDYLEKRLLAGKKNGNLQKELGELIILRKFIALKAIPQTIEMVENAIELGKKIIIFTTFTEELDILVNHFGKLCVKHNGPMSTIQKQRSVDSFQNDPNVRVFIGNIRSAGVAITLTEATVVVFNSYEWVPGYNEQSSDRAYRIGQKNDVTVYFQLFEDTISTRMWETLLMKQSVIDRILNSEITEDDIIEDLMSEIINTQ